MSLFTALKRFMRYLDQRGVEYQFLNHPPGRAPLDVARDLGIDPDALAEAVLLEDRLGARMLVYPATDRPDPAVINRKFRRNFKTLDDAEIKRRYPDCPAGYCVPLAEIYELDAYIDRRLADHDAVYFALDQRTLCKIRGDDFRAIQKRAIWFEPERKPRAKPAAGPDGVEQASAATIEDRRKRIRNRLARLDTLPAMPKLANEILQLSANPYANTHDLAAVIEQDPSLSAQLMRYARSSFYGYRGQLDSLHQAISRVLGFDMVMDMALGIALGKSFRIPQGGPLGLKAFWQHATYSAMLVQRLGEAVDVVHRPRPGMAYLSGLLQNIGLLVLGQLFKQEYAILNNALTRYPDLGLNDIELNVLGITHAEIGSWLMEAWDMPGELLIAVREHHNERYADTHATYANLVLIANRLLYTIDVGDEDSDAMPLALLERVGLDSARALQIFNKLIQDRAGLDYMATQMAA